MGYSNKKDYEQSHIHMIIKKTLSKDNPNSYTAHFSHLTGGQRGN